jgi:hypothetical protein
MFCSIAQKLEEGRLAQIQALERELGMTIVAFACRTLDPAREERLRKIEAELGPVLLAPPASPSEEQLERLRQLEEASGLALVAVEA